MTEKEIWMKAIKIVSAVRFGYASNASREQVLLSQKTTIIRHLAEHGQLSPDEIAEATK